MLALTIQGTTTLLFEDQHQHAMRQYWDARNNGDESAALVRVADDGEAEEAREMFGPMTSSTPPIPTVQSAPGAVSAVALARVNADEAVLRGAGFALKPTLYAPGTRVIALGDENFRLERQRVEELPPFMEACRAITKTVRAEERADVQVKLGDLCLLDDGPLETKSGTFHLERNAFEQLASLVGFGCGARYLSERCSPQLRAQNVNWQLAMGKRDDVVLRTRRGKSGRSVFAVVTPKYSICDAPEVLDAVSPALADAHAEIVYDGAGVRGQALFIPDHIVDLACGDVFKVGVRIECDDTGRGRIRISAVVFRNRCLNLIVIDEAQSETLSAVHRGAAEKMRALVRDGVEKARAKVGMFLERWGHARSLRVDVEETFEQWTEDGVVNVPGVKSEDLVKHLVAAWREEPGDTLADAANALTRVAHKVPTFDLSVREMLERAAGKIVMAVR